jgi:hypothetical protein
MAESRKPSNSGHPHIAIDVFRQVSAYQFPPRPQNRKQLRDDYALHATQLLTQLSTALGKVPQTGEDTRLRLTGLKPGAIVEVLTAPPSTGSRTKATRVPSALDFPKHDVVVLQSKRNDDFSESALLFVPDAAREFLTDRIKHYGLDPGSHKRTDIERFEAIEELRAAEATSLFLTDVDFKTVEVVWWELWIRQPVVSADTVAAAAQSMEIDVHSERLQFPDTTILFVHAAATTLVNFVRKVPGAITEIRQATGTIAPFLERGAGGGDQHAWVTEMAQRIAPPSSDAPVVCVLDTGVAASHPLIAPALHGAWAYDDQWGTDDHGPDGGHGTSIAGLVLYGDLEPLMNGTGAIELNHAVESMKFLPPAGFPATQPPKYGIVTQGAVASVETLRPKKIRSYCLATSATDFPPNRPSTWSGAIDQIASGSMIGDIDDKIPASKRMKRLLVVATGNVSGGMALDVLPSQPLEDPSQSWNALTIGGFTRKEQPPAPPPVLKPVVPGNHRSPFSRGSQSLPNELVPIKPEVLFEAGNMSSDSTGYCAWEPSMSLLSTGSDVVSEPLVPFWATSAATGMAGNFLGRLQATHPELWPETHRALVVDSARWPQPIRKKFIGTGAYWKAGTKAEKQRHLREFGYGVPDIERALTSALNDATLIAQAELQPYTLGADGKSAVFNEMHFYDLPWPRHSLEQLENAIVTMKVTLSYFIEPNLSGKAATRPDTYRSFGLRFDMKKRGESSKHFRSRITASQTSEGIGVDGEASRWLLGPKAIQAGSLHCDLWRGRAIELAGHDEIAIYPVGGWWKSHTGQKRFKDKARYSLVISISASDLDVDLYSEIFAEVTAKEVEVILG